MGVKNLEVDPPQKQQNSPISLLLQCHFTMKIVIFLPASSEWIFGIFLDDIWPQGIFIGKQNSILPLSKYESYHENTLKYFPRQKSSKEKTDGFFPRSACSVWDCLEATLVIHFFYVKGDFLRLTAACHSFTLISADCFPYRRGRQQDELSVMNVSLETSNNNLSGRCEPVGTPRRTCEAGRDRKTLGNSSLL